MKMTDYAIETYQLTKKFGDLIAVDNLNLKVKKGEIFGFLGPNGAGKSTTIRMLCGILDPTEGTATVAGFDITQNPEKIKQHIGYMSQQFSLYQDLTIEENIDFYNGVYQVPSNLREQQKRQILQFTGLAGREKNTVGTLSGGLKQRLSFGCAILHQPQILFLDEPTAGLDPLSRHNFWDLIYQMANTGTTVFVTTHYMDEAEHCSTLGLIYNGQLIACDTPAQLKTNQMKGEVLQVDCQPVMPALEIIRTHPNVIDAATFGLLLHVIVKQAKPAIPALNNLLTNNHIKVNQIEKIAPSLEDVFVFLLETQDKSAARTQFRNP